MSGASETGGPEATERVGAELAARLRPGDVVLVSGDLGSGKTTFVRGALRALGVTEAITSPTFVVGILYDGAAGPLAHLDLYRLAGLEDEDPGLLDPTSRPTRSRSSNGPSGPSPRRCSAGAAIARHVTLAHAGGDRRRIEVRA